MEKQLIELILTESAKPVSQRAEVVHAPKGVVIETLVELSESGVPIVSFDDVPELIVARSTITISRNQVGKDAVLTFERGDLRKPIIVGILQCPKPPNPEVQLDGERLIFTADKEIVLKCGESSITLNAQGKS